MTSLSYYDIIMLSSLFSTPPSGSHDVGKCAVQLTLPHGISVYRRSREVGTWMPFPAAGMLCPEKGFPISVKSHKNKYCTLKCLWTLSCIEISQKCFCVICCWVNRLDPSMTKASPKKVSDNLLLSFSHFALSPHGDVMIRGIAWFKTANGPGTN